jgi:hypothetical protein
VNQQSKNAEGLRPSADESEWKQTLKQQTDEAFRALRWNRRLNSVISVLFLVIGITLLGVLTRYIVTHSDPMANLLLRVRFEGGQGLSVQDVTPMYIERVFAVTWPIVLQAIVAVGSVLFALRIHRKSVATFQEGLEGVSRLRREAAVGVPRSRALTDVLEETLKNAKQAFSVSLWISRTLFVVGLALLVTVFIQSIARNELDLVTGALATGSVISLIASWLTRPQRDIATDLGNITQLQAILASYTRQAALLEEHVYQVLEHYRRIGDPEGASESVTKGTTRLSAVLAKAVDAIQSNVERAENAS